MIIKTSQFKLLQQLKVNDIFILELRFFKICSLMTLNLFSIKILIVSDEKAADQISAFEKAF